MGDAIDTANYIGLTAEIVSAYVSNNTVASADIPALISQVHTALQRGSSGEPQASTEPLKPAVSVKKSINPDFIICLEDGKKFKSLKRHLRTQYNMTPEQYREKWGLPADYPMVAPNYAAAPLAACQADGTRSAAPPPPLGHMVASVISLPSPAPYWRRGECDRPWSGSRSSVAA